MSIIKPLILAGTLLIFVGCDGNKNENKDPTPTPTPAASPEANKPSKPLETPCKEGKLLLRHAYSECGPDHFWHVVEDDYYNCPPVKAFRVADTKTEQTCENGKPVPEGLSPYRDIKDLCPNPKDTGDKITVTECFHGQWRTATYTVYVCPETGAKGIHKDHPDSVIEHHKACTEPMPPLAPPTP